MHFAADRNRYVTAIQKRGIHFRTLYTFYSKDQNARIKFVNRVGAAFYFFLSRLFSLFLLTLLHFF